MDEQAIREMEIEVAIKAFGFRWYVVPQERGPLRVMATPEMAAEEPNFYTEWNGDESIPIAADAYRDVPRFARDPAAILEALDWFLSHPACIGVTKDRGCYILAFWREDGPGLISETSATGAVLGEALCSAIKQLATDLPPKA